MRREIGRSWALFSMFWSTGLAYTLSVLCYQLMTFKAHSETGIFWIGGVLLFWVITIFVLRSFAESNKRTAHAPGC